MNLSKLFETQKQLDDRIEKEHGLQGKDLLDDKILALQVELGELANEWRGFKYWKRNREPRTEISSTDMSAKDFDFYQCTCHNIKYKPSDENVRKFKSIRFGECPKCGDEMHRMVKRNPLLEEYVDCLHFIISIGNDLGVSTEDTYKNYISRDLTFQFNHVFLDIGSLGALVASEMYGEASSCHASVMEGFIGLGEMLGFTWEKIEQAYFRKNQINHERQANGY